MEERETFAMENMASDMMAYVEKKAIKANQSEPEDYIGEDGLLYCGRCHTARQIRYMGRIGFVLCDCRQAAQNERLAKRKEMERAEQIEALRLDCFPESTMCEWTFQNDDGMNPKYSKIATQYTEHFDEMKKKGAGLLIYGLPGTGKSYLAACIANRLIDKGRRVHMTNFSRIVNLIQNRFEGRQDYIDSLNRYSLLILDDLGIERKTGYMQENVYTIIDNRYRLGLPMIITTNLMPQDFRTDDVALKRIYDRIIERCFPLHVEGVNRRYSQGKSNMEDVRGLLGL